MSGLRSASETRQALIEAAINVAYRDGAATLTFEAVAREAGVSKGGLLHHFPNKEALVGAMLQALIQRFELILDATLKQDHGAEDGRWTRAYVRANFNDDPRMFEMNASLIAAAMMKPELLEPLRESFAHWQALAEQDGLDPVIATVIRLAADGLWFAELFGLAPPQEPLRSKVAEVLETLGNKYSTTSNM